MHSAFLLLCNFARVHAKVAKDLNITNCSMKFAAKINVLTIYFFNGMSFDVFVLPFYYNLAPKSPLLRWKITFTSLCLFVK